MSDGTRRDEGQRYEIRLKSGLEALMALSPEDYGPVMDTTASRFFRDKSPARKVCRLYNRTAKSVGLRARWRVVDRIGEQQP